MGKVYLAGWRGEIKQRRIHLLVVVLGNFPPSPQGLFELEFLEHPWRASQKIGSCTPDSCFFLRAGYHGVTPFGLRFLERSSPKQALNIVSSHNWRQWHIRGKRQTSAAAAIQVRGQDWGRASSFLLHTFFFDSRESELGRCSGQFGSCYPFFPALYIRGKAVVSALT